MLLFQDPPITRYDLHFTFLGFPVRVHPLFWLVAFILGFSFTNLAQVLIWIPVVFVSILIHELGHALAMRSYGQDARIVLHGAGGVTIPESVWWGSRLASVTLSPTQEMFIALAGPLAGFVLASLVILFVLLTGGTVDLALLWGFLPFPKISLSFGGALAYLIVANLLWVNLFWGLLNIMPVFPLDGGTIARYFLIKSDPWDGGRKSLWLSVITGGLIAVLGLVLLGSIYAALLFGLLAFQSYQMLQRSA